MTEYKKLEAIVAELRGFNDELAAAAADSAPDAAHRGAALVGRIDAIVADAAPRMQKLLLKAREKDPNRQVYNEMMVGKIEALGVAFREACEQLYDVPQQQESGAEEDQTVQAPESDDVMQLRYSHGARMLRLVEAYEDALIAQARDAARAAELMTSAAMLLTREDEGRTVVAATERRQRHQIAADFAEGRAAVTAVLQERERRRWMAELQRRAVEQQLLRTAVFDESTGALRESLVRDTAAALAATAAGRFVLRNLYELLTEVLAHPENVNVRVLRNANKRFIANFGHPAAAAALPGSVAGDAAGFWQLYPHVERLLVAFGYVVQYTPKPHSDAIALLHTGLKGGPRGCVDAPCAAVGFEDYGDRQLVLKEPPADEQPDEWWMWRERADAIVAVIDRALR